MTTATVPASARTRDDVFRVSGTSNVGNVAGAIANQVREFDRAIVTAIGAAAVNQAVKAIAVARGFVAPSGKNLVCTPGFDDVTVEGETRTTIRFLIEAI